MSSIDDCVKLKQAKIPAFASSSIDKPEKENLLCHIAQAALRFLVLLYQKFHLFFAEASAIFQILFTRPPIQKGEERELNIPIIFIHGLFGSQSNWNLTCKKLEALGANQLGRFYPISLPIGNCLLTQDVEHVKCFVNQLVSHHPTGRVHLVGHSRGGVIAALCADQLNQDGRYPVASVATLASPLKGCPLASWANRDIFGYRFNPSRDLALKSEMVDSVAKLCDLSIQSSNRFRALHLVSQDDWIVPSKYQTFTDDELCTIPAGHLAILAHQKSLATLHNWLCQPSTDASAV